MSEQPSGVKKGPMVESPEEVLSTMDKQGRRRWIYPTLSAGSLWRWRRVVGWLLIALFFAMPIVHINGRPALFLDIVHRRFAILGGQFYATDTMLLWLFGLATMLAIAIFTAIFGRVWCGWACPQTVYMEFVFRPIERLIEGKESQRKRRDEEPSSPERAARRGLKYFIFLLISAAMSHTFVAYFVSWSVLLEWMGSSPRDHWGFFLIMAGVTGLTFFDFAYFREQMCTIACPYARMQSVIQDRDSLIVSYDPGRGEPRGRRRAKNARGDEQADGSVKLVLPELGDCIDCGACVRTCPTGIDIRDGLQMECIGCAQCVDACDAIMIQVKKPVGLIRYTSENALEGKAVRWLRMRVVFYAALMVAVLGLFFVTLQGVGQIEAKMFRVPGAAYNLMPKGEVSNRVRLQVRNRTDKAHVLRVEVVEPTSARVMVVGATSVQLAPAELSSVEVWLIVPETEFRAGRATMKLRIWAGDQISEQISFSLLGPES